LRLATALTIPFSFFLLEYPCIAQFLLNQLVADASSVMMMTKAEKRRLQELMEDEPELTEVVCKLSGKGEGRKDL